MSEREFDRYQSGELLENDTDHSKNGGHTDSVGFCFFPEEPDDAIRWLSGIVNDDVCATFDVPDHLVTKSRGTYCDPDKSDNSFGAVLADIFSHLMGDEMENAVTMDRVEYCCTEYDREHFRLVTFKYSKRILAEHECMAEWKRPAEQLPEGVLLQGVMTGYNCFEVGSMIHDALKKTPLQGDMTTSIGLYQRPKITLPDGREVYSGDRVEVHSDGVVLINGSLMADGFPRLTFNTGCCPGDQHWGLEGYNDKTIEIPEQLYMKYEAARREGI